MFLHADSEDWADAQAADLSLRWVQRSMCWFCHAAAHLCGTNEGEIFFILFWCYSELLKTA